MKLKKKLYDLKSLEFLKNSNSKVGILGGSFNPAHCGHYMISVQALDCYNFDYIIWLVANQNPIKPKYKDNIFTRGKNALPIIKDPRIIVSTAEYDLGTYYTYDTLKALQDRFKGVDFTWLMGMDNVYHFDKWYKYEEILKMCKIIVFDRPIDEIKISLDSFKIKFKAFIDKSKAGNIIIHRGILDKTSSSQIRDKLKKDND